MSRVHAHAAIRRERDRLQIVLESLAVDRGVPLVVSSLITTAINDLATAEDTLVCLINAEGWPRR